MAPKLHFNQSSVTFDLRPLIFDASLMLTDDPGESVALKPGYSSQYYVTTYTVGYTGWPPKMQRF